MLSLLRDFIEDPARLIPIAAAIAGVAAVLAAAWPYLRPDDLGRRLAYVADERNRMAARALKDLAIEDEVQKLRRNAPRRSYQVIVQAFNLSAKLDDADLAQRLQQAGFRGKNLAVKFLAFRVIMSVALAAAYGLCGYFLFAASYALLVHGLAALAAGALGFVAPGVYVKNTIAKRQVEIRRNWPDALDLMLICVESGMSIEGAFRKVAEEIGLSSPILAEELSLTTAELSYLQDRRKAYDGFSQRTGLEAVRSVMTSLIQAEKYGTPIGRTLRVLAQESRDQRMSLAEKKAASLPPKLTVPMIIFFLPVLFAVIMAPAIIDILR